MDDAAVTAERRAAEWGLAALTLGGVLVLMGPPCMTLIFLIQSSGFSGFGRTDRFLAGVGGGLAGVVLIGFGVAGIVFGGMAIAAARRATRPIARGLVGVMLNGFAVFVFVCALLAWIGGVL